MRATKKQNTDGTFTYMFDGEVIKKASKKDYEYTAYYGGTLVGFGKMSTCNAILTREIKQANINIRYCHKVVDWITGKSEERPNCIHGERSANDVNEYLESIKRCEEKINTCTVLKIETIE